MIDNEALGVTPRMAPWALDANDYQLARQTVPHQWNVALAWWWLIACVAGVVPQLGSAWLWAIGVALLILGVQGLVRLMLPASLPTDPRLMVRAMRGMWASLRCANTALMYAMTFLPSLLCVALIHRHFPRLWVSMGYVAGVCVVWMLGEAGVRLWRAWRPDQVPALSETMQWQAGIASPELRAWVESRYPGASPQMMAHEVRLEIARMRALRGRWQRLGVAGASMLLGLSGVVVVWLAHHGHPWQQAAAVSGGLWLWVCVASLVALLPGVTYAVWSEVLLRRLRAHDRSDPMMGAGTLGAGMNALWSGLVGWLVMEVAAMSLLAHSMANDHGRGLVLVMAVCLLAMGGVATVVLWRTGRRMDLSGT